MVDVSDLRRKTDAILIQLEREGTGENAKARGVGNFSFHSFNPDIPSFFYLSVPNLLTNSLNITKVLIDMASQNPIITASAKFPKPSERTFQYGTAGVSSRDN